MTLQPGNNTPYDICPVYETERFLFRLVKEEDAQDLLTCYADPQSARFFNSDNCTSNFIFKTAEEIQNCIRFWIADYERRAYVRFTIVDKDSMRAVGTFECFAKPETFEGFGKVGILRIDLGSQFENEDDLTEILTMVESKLFDCFGVQSMLTKAVPEAEKRITALKRSGYRSLPPRTIMPYGDYFAAGPH